MNNEDAMEVTKNSLLEMVTYNLISKRHEGCINEMIKSDLMVLVIILKKY